jgi:epoxide hydrolase 4
MFTAMFTRVVSGETSSDAIWHNKVPVALSEPAVDIDKDPNLLHKYAENAGTKIHYVTMGSNQKPLMVFVHGFPDFWYSWRNQIQAFSANYQVVALDLRGYDLSDRPEGVENYKFPVLLDDIRAVINAERNGRKAILIGHDWGAALSWLFTGQNPDLIERLAVLSVPHPGAITRELLPWNHPIAQARASAYATRFFAQGKGDNLTAQDLAYWVVDPQVKSRYIQAFREIFHLVHDELLQSQLRVFSACAQSFRSNHEETLRCRDQMPGLACARNRGEPRFAKHY